MNKKISLGAAIAFMVIIAGITFCITMMVSLDYFNEMVLNVKAREEMYKKLADVDRSARQNYAGKIDEETLSDNISAGYIRGLGDRYSSYVTKPDYEYLVLERSGKLGQIGLAVQKDTSGYFLVTGVTENSPSASAGIIVGDIIISIDDIDLQKTSQTAAERLLMGEIGAKVSVVSRRDGVDTTNSLARKAIERKYIASNMIDKVGYIKISAFATDTASQFKVAVDSLVRAGATALVFDIRNNNTDSIEAAASMLDTLLPSGSLGTYKSSIGEAQQIAQSDQYAINLPMAVLMNSKTGNAAEYFAATLRDFLKTNIIGTQSVGKAISQELIKLTDGSALNITTAYVYPPSGTEINGIGISPDYEVKLTAEQEQAFDLMEQSADPQLQKALDVVNSKVEQ